MFASLPNGSTAASAPLSGLGNFFGVDIEHGASNNFVIDNWVTRNVSVGVGITSATSTGNIVQNNHIEANGAYGLPHPDDDTIATLVPMLLAGPDRWEFGAGIYIDMAKSNIIGSSAQPAGTKNGKAAKKLAQAGKHAPR